MQNFLKFRFIPGTPMEKAAYAVVRRLQEAGHKAFFVGGAVRDLLLGRTPDDIDVTTSALPDRISALFDKAIPLGASFGIITVIMDEIPVEVATFRAERGYSDGRHPDHVEYTDQEELDVTRRDFTVNGLLLNPVEGMVYDYVGGLSDLKRGYLRAIGDPLVRFSEDQLRILRFVRFTASLGFEPDEATASAAKHFADRIDSVAKERVKNELEKILTGADPECGMRLLDQLDIMREVLPGIFALHGKEQPAKYHPEGDAFEHTMLLLRHAFWRTPQVMWSALLHDIGKGVTQSWKDGVPHFYGHEAVGAAMAEDVMRDLRASRELMDCVSTTVRNHMRFSHVDEMKPAKWKRIIREPNFPVELEIHRLDCMACHGLMENYLLMLDRMIQLEREPVPVAPFLTGQDLIGQGIVPGPVFKVILGEAEDLQLEGIFRNREDALNWLSVRKMTILKMKQHFRV